MDERDEKIENLTKEVKELKKAAYAAGTLYFLNNTESGKQVSGALQRFNRGCLNFGCGAFAILAIISIICKIIAFLWAAAIGMNAVPYGRYHLAMQDLRKTAAAGSGDAMYKIGLLYASVVSQADGILSKVFLARRILSRIFSTLAVHTNALGSALWLTM